MHVYISMCSPTLDFSYIVAHVTPMMCYLMMSFIILLVLLVNFQTAVFVKVHEFLVRSKLEIQIAVLIYRNIEKTSGGTKVEG